MNITIESFLLDLLVILLSAKLFGELAERWRQPAVLGELLGGVLLGAGLVGFFDPRHPALALMAEFGVVLLLFEAGINSELHELARAGPMSLAVACIGVAAPFAMGWAALTLLGHAGLPAVFIGAAMTATSVGITARVLADLGQLQSREAQIVLGAAVIDDIIGMILLSAVSGVAAAGRLDWLGVGKTVAAAALFLGAALAFGPALSRRLVAVVERMRVRGVLIVTAVCFAFAMALLARAAGSALIVGAFCAGLLLASTDRQADIDQTLKPVSDIFVPIFFVMVGAKVDLGLLNPLVAANRPTLGAAALLIALAIFGKLVSGLGARQPGIRPWRVGVGMIPRGEVGLIFAGIGLASGVIDGPLYGAVVGMVVATTFVAPPLLTRAFRDS